MSRAVYHAQIVRGFIEAGATRDAALAMTDAAFHASEQAIETAHRICGALPGNDALAAYGVAMQLVEVLARANAETAQNAIKQRGRYSTADVSMSALQ